MMLCPVHLRTALCYVPAAALYIGDAGTIITRTGLNR